MCIRDRIYWASQVYDTVAKIEASQDPSLMEIPVFKMALEAMPTTCLLYTSSGNLSAGDAIMCGSSAWDEWTSTGIWMRCLPHLRK